MTIFTTNQARITLKLVDRQNLTYDQIFKIAQYIDAYEIDKQLQDNLVIDIQKVTKAGEIELVLTPKNGLRYSEIADHLKMILQYALENVNLADSKWEILKIEFQPEMPGKPSYFTSNSH
jgi:hypothetical protein